MELIEELLHVALVGDLSDHLFFLFLDFIHVVSSFFINKVSFWVKLNRLLVFRNDEFFNKSGALGLGNETVAVEIVLSEESIELVQVGLRLASLVKDIVEHLKAFPLVKESVSVKVIFGKYLLDHLGDLVSVLRSIGIVLDEMCHLSS